MKYNCIQTVVYTYLHVTLGHGEQCMLNHGVSKYSYQLCVPLSENVKLQFIQKDIVLFKTSYILVCSKTFLRLCIKQKV